MARRRNTDPAAVSEVRSWGREHGFEVGARGRLSSELASAFTKATGRPIGRVEEPATR